MTLPAFTGVLKLQVYLLQRSCDGPRRAGIQIRPFRGRCSKFDAARRNLNSLLIIDRKRHPPSMDLGPPTQLLPQNSFSMARSAERVHRAGPPRTQKCRFAWSAVNANCFRFALEDPSADLTHRILGLRFADAIA